MGAVLCQRGDPEAKGLVERANGYLETSFLPGRRFEDVADFLDVDWPGPAMVSPFHHSTGRWGTRYQSRAIQRISS